MSNKILDYLSFTKYINFFSKTYGGVDCIVENTWKFNMLTLKEISNNYESIIKNFSNQEQIQ
ncbi:hypothetical protein [Mycoplasma capricolum]|uniref:hypothetical protein n=1 Tax=Mycoplasma capricolum TaxID=2095 RepID=UPI003DA623E4